MYEVQYYRILVSVETCGVMPSECLDRGTIRIPTSVTVAGSNTVRARSDIQLAGTEFERLNASEDEYPRT